jgi:Xaa-Pro aminopeptidase
MTTIEKLQILRELMAQKGMDAYLVPTEDYHASEYVGDFFKAREYMSGFTGSAGTLLVTAEEAALWTDGRYFLQAEAQLAGSGITLMKSGEPGVQKLEEYLAKRLPQDACLGFDGRTVSKHFAEQLKKDTAEKNLRFQGDFDLVGEIWKDRPAMSAEPVWELPEKYAGSPREEKLSRLRSTMAEKGADVCLLTTLDDIAWLFNLRGGDVAYTPVFLSYALIAENSALLFAQEQSFSAEIREKLAQAGVELASYGAVEEVLSGLPDGTTLLADGRVMNYRLASCLPKTVKLLEVRSPIVAMKAVKNEQEQEHEREAHKKDGVALTRFIYWLKHNVGKEKITEISAAEKLQELRSQQEGYLMDSFAPIIAYGAHGAIVHYEATEETNVELQPRGFCLADTGGHYMQGATDVTRTIGLGELTPEEIHAYTIVLRGHLNLYGAIFLRGICGLNLDILARQPLWQEYLDYNHGTGHGVGYLLNVHEGPQRFHWRMRAGDPVVPMEPGMITSDEPGLYMEGKFGIRHENLLLTIDDEKDSRFLKFEALTLVPFDRDAIDVSLLTDRELELLNDYHARVCQMIAPQLPTEEAEWLREVTAPLVK